MIWLLIAALSCSSRLNHTVILEDPFDDPPDLPVPDRSPEPTKEQLDVSSRQDIHKCKIACWTNHSCLRRAEWTDRSGWSHRRYRWERSRGAGWESEGQRSQDSGHSAGDGETNALLSRHQRCSNRPLFTVCDAAQVGDLPDADMKPPENVLFVCKLNPVTTDEDLEIIFSRFGQIKRFLKVQMLYAQTYRCRLWTDVTLLPVAARSSETGKLENPCATLSLNLKRWDRRAVVHTR